MGSHTITCAQGCTFDAPSELTAAALTLHNRTLHDPPEGKACDHDWNKPWHDSSDLVSCRKCGKYKYVLRWGRL